jgi:hypothetical protein
MLINVFNYLTHIVSIRAYGGTFEYIVGGTVQGTEYSEKEAVQAAKKFIEYYLVGWRDEEKNAI